MVSRLTVLGLIFAVIGAIPLIINTFQLMTLPLMAGSGPIIMNNVPLGVGAGTSEGLGISNSHPLFVNVRVEFILSSPDAISCNAWITIDAAAGSGTLGQVSQLTGPSGTDTRYVLTGIVPPSYTSSSFSINLNILNTGPNTLELKDRRVQVFYSLWGQVLPGLIFVIGLVLIIFGFMQGRKTRVRKPTPVTPGWEPTLQWSGGARGTRDTPKESKKSRFSIRSSKQPTTVQRKVVRKAAPASAGQIDCKFCGKKVSPTAFFCPHCYGKLR
ncbi:MAG: zinc ribbon domain-containing protein [Candidatus Heimdallarchaeota archaeon]